MNNNLKVKKYSLHIKYNVNVMKVYCTHFFPSF